MAQAIGQPVTQKRLTNIALVKYKSHGKRFEIACFRNKVRDWRDGKEKDINEVLQTTSVFFNVSKGIFASAADLHQAFGTSDEEAVCRIILDKGELQVSDKEREQYLEELFRDVATLCTERLVHASTKRQLTVQMVTDALKSVHFNMRSGDSAKKQSLKAIELLTTKMPESFVRANMRLCIIAPDTARKEVDDNLKEICDPLVLLSNEVDASTASYSVTFECLPSCYRPLDKLVTTLGKQARMQVIESCVADKEEREGDQIAWDMSRMGISNSASASAVPGEATPTAGEVTPTAASLPSEPAKPVGPSCATCNVELQEAFRAHCKTEWHNFNVKRKVKQLAPVSAEEFEEIKFDTEFMANFRGVD